MTAENNTKYIAEMWLESVEDEDFKKSFLVSLLKEWQNHDNGFDADTVDKMHWDDIKKYIDNFNSTTMKSFNIGYTAFSNTRDSTCYFLGFEGIKLYNKEFDGPTNEDKKLPWREVSPENIPNLHTVINELFTQTYLGEEDDEIKTNKEIFDSFKELICGPNGINSRLTFLENLLEGKIVDGKLDADSVNGIRFFIYTPEQYEELKRKALFDEESARKLNSVHNYFIIKTREEIINAGYEGGVYPYNPDTAVIDKHYKFRVFNTTAYDEDSGENITGPWLQYKHEDSDTWLNLCPVKSFVKPENVTPILIDVLRNNTTYVLNSDALRNALNDINITDNSQLPLAQYNRNTYIKGAVYDYVNDDNRKDVASIEMDNFQYLNLTNFKNGLTEQIDGVLGELNNYKTRLEGANGNGGIIGDIRGQIASIPTGSSVDESSFDSKLGLINSRLNTIEESLAGVYDWGVSNLETVSEGQNGCFIYYNESLKIAYFVYNVFFAWNGESTGWNSRSTLQSKFSISSSSDIVPDNLRPKATVIFPTSDKTVICGINAQTGEVKLKIDGGKDYTKRQLWGAVMYRIKD